MLSFLYAHYQHTTEMSDLQYKRQLSNQWQRCLTECIETDSWGQQVEAIESYDRLIQHIQSSIDINNNINLYNTVIVLNIRKNILNDVVNLNYNNRHNNYNNNNNNSITLDYIKLLKQVFIDYGTNKLNTIFPIQLDKYVNNHSNNNHINNNNHNNDDEFIDETDDNDNNNNNVVTKQLNNNNGWYNIQSGHTYLKLYIYKIGLKDIEIYNKPQITVNLVNKNNSSIVESYNIYSNGMCKNQHIYFQQDIYIQCDLQSIEYNQYVLFIEFKHFKQDKNKISTRCYSIIEYNEITKSMNNGNICLELYKKPVDYTLKRIQLHTIKPLYMHCSINTQRT